MNILHPLLDFSDDFYITMNLIAICVYVYFLSEETIRRKRKGLRDTYVKEKKERKSGSGASQGKRWKYSALVFPFFSRKTGLQSIQEDQTGVRTQQRAVRE